MLKVDVRVGESVSLNGTGKATIRLVAKSGQLARLEIDADESVKITPPMRKSARQVIRDGMD